MRDLKFLHQLWFRQWYLSSFYQMVAIMVRSSTNQEVWGYESKTTMRQSFCIKYHLTLPLASVSSSSCISLAFLLLLLLRFLILMLPLSLLFFSPPPKLKYMILQHTQPYTRTVDQIFPCARCRRSWPTCQEHHTQVCDKQWDNKAVSSVACLLSLLLSS